MVKGFLISGIYLPYYAIAFRCCGCLTGISRLICTEVIDMTHQRPANGFTGCVKLLLAAAIASQASCGSSSNGDKFPLPAGLDKDAPYIISITGADLSTIIDNTYFPAPVAATWVYEVTTDEGTEHIDVIVLDPADPKGTKVVMGANARVIQDTVRLNGVVIEDTWDWYGQDADGNVWYIGEDTAEFENGVFVCNCGAWEWGVDGALPGYLMLADPQVGDAYRQEYYESEAEDVAEVVALNVAVTVAAGVFTGCVKTREVSVIDRSYEEFKYYCPGIGVVLEEADDERLELISYTGLTPL